jgi:hypothetical protein
LSRQALGAFADEAGGAGVGEKLFEVAGFFHGGAAAGFGEAVVAAALVVVLGVGALFEFFDEILFEEAFDGAVEGAGTEADFAGGAFGDFLHDGIAVAVAVGESYENVKGVSGEEEGSHGWTISGFAIAGKGVLERRQKAG